MSVSWIARFLVLVVAAPFGIGCDGKDGAPGQPGMRGEPGAQGPQGPQGPPGEDFDPSPRLFGDGRDGDLLVPSGEGVVFDPWMQYATVKIEAGGTLFVRSGTVMRCAGDFENDGTVTVGSGAEGGRRAFGNSPPADTLPRTVAPHPGLAWSSAEFGTYDTELPFVARGGRGGLGIGLSAFDQTHIMPYAGGGGADTWPFTRSSTVAGGGAFHVLVGGELLNAGTIRAFGENASVISRSGGGGGGAVLLASAVSIDNSGGEISVGGGDGAAGSSQIGAGGGGGGGFIHMIAPIVDEGIADVGGGTAGLDTLFTSTLRWIGGGGGGGSAGNGGSGAGNDGTAQQPATDGGEGQLFVRLIDPAFVL